MAVLRNTRCGCDHWIVSVYLQGLLFEVLHVNVVLLHVLNHKVDQVVEVVFGLPVPVSTGLGVVEHLWPRVGNQLAAVRLVGHVQIGHVLAQFVHQFFRREGHGSYVVDAVL